MTEKGAQYIILLVFFTQSKAGVLKVDIFRCSLHEFGKAIKIAIN